MRGATSLWRLTVLGLLAGACSAAPASRPAPAASPAPAARAADIVLRGGRVLTMDPARPRASALAITGARIVFVGDDAEAARWIGAKTRTIELRGRSVVPALTDAHAHLTGLAETLEQVDLEGCRSADDCADRLKDAVRTAREDEWVRGRGWDQNLFPDASFPGRAALDRVSPERAVWLRRRDGHVGWANARALALAKVDRNTPDPPGGRLLRDANGEPTGILVDNAMNLVLRVLPPIGEPARERTLQRAQRRVLEQGITEVHEMGIDAATVRRYRRLAAEGKLAIRVYAFRSSQGELEDALASEPDGITPDAWVTVRGIKLFADGSLGSRGAALLAPYADDEEQRGLFVTPPELLERAATRALARGWQIATHAIGDRANRTVLDAYERAGCTTGRDHRFRVEHAQVLALPDIARFARLGVIASMQPTHATSDMAWAGRRLGPERLAGAYAWRKVLDSGARVAWGSDFPVEDVSLLAGLHAAVTRQDREGRPPGGWRPEERLRVDEALAGFTTGAAYAAFEESWRGRAAPGQVADLTVFDGDVTDPALLLRLHADVTIVGGRVAYERTAE